MKITRDNYEIWFIDYLEGRLDKEGMEAVQNFLIHHPNLAEELDTEIITLHTDHNSRFAGKESLKKEPLDDPAVFETAAIASMEGDLTEEEAISLEKWLAKNPGKKEQIRQLENTRLQTDLSVGFPGRERLKKKTTVIALWMQVAAVAAILLLAILLFYPEKKLPEQVAVKIAETVDPQKPAPIPNEVAAGKPVIPATSAKNMRQRPEVRRQALPERAILISMEERRREPVETLKPREVTLGSGAPVLNDLIPVGKSDLLYAENKEIPISDYLTAKLQVLKAEEKKQFFSREELKIFGLRLFSKLPGHRLTGKEGQDGKLRSITFNTQLLAFSIPVNR